MLEAAVIVSEIVPEKVVLPKEEYGTVKLAEPVAAPAVTV